MRCFGGRHQIDPVGLTFATLLFQPEKLLAGCLARKRTPDHPTFLLGQEGNAACPRSVLQFSLHAVEELWHAGHGDGRGESLWGAVAGDGGEAGIDP